MRGRHGGSELGWDRRGCLFNVLYVGRLSLIAKGTLPASTRRSQMQQNQSFIFFRYGFHQVSFALPWFPLLKLGLCLA